MAENPPVVMQPGNDEGHDAGVYNDDEESDSSIYESDKATDEKACTKIKLPEHIAAYIEKRELIRSAETVKCESSLLEKVMLNYIIAKKILGNLSWQDKMLCKQVCSTWHSAVHALQKEQMSAVDFIMDVRRSPYSAKFKKSGNFENEPLAVLTFGNIRGFNMSCQCEEFYPSFCTPPCESEHYLIDVMHNYISAPKNCMLTSITQYMSYMPHPQALTASQTISRHNMFTVRSRPLICGVFIPIIPDVKFHVINIQNVNRNTMDMQNDFFQVIDKLAQTRIFKGVLVYVTEKFLLHSVEDIMFLDYLKKVQPDIPYALGGCIVEETMSEPSDINIMIERRNDGYNFVSENFISIGLFTVPKTDSTDSGEKYNFDMYSLVIESSDWSKPKIQQTINEFAKKVPHFEHSVALKLSCVGRDQKHDIEQDYFRAAFPHTTIVGCYGNGELGVNHPQRPAPASPRTVKRHKHDPGPQGLMYSYSTVFMYIGWGKITSTEGS